MSPSSSSHMVELKNSNHQIPAGSKALRQSNGLRWLELTLGVRRNKALPGLGAMPGFGESLNNQQIAELARFMLRQFAPGQPAWTNLEQTTARLRQTVSANGS